MENNNGTFRYTYSAEQQEEIRSIRKKYLPREPEGMDKMERLRRLDRSAAKKGTAVSILLGLLFVFLGNMMGKIKPNYFFGVRTPWTLADPDVWNRSHRLAGRLFFLAGLVTILSALLLPEAALFAVLMGSVLGAALATVLMSYLWYRKKHRQET